MNVLVTGGAGLIGSHLCDILLDNKHNVTVWDDLSFGKNINPETTFIEGDVRNLSIDQQRYDIIFHLASLKKVWDGSIHSSDVMDVNFAMTKAVVDKALKDDSKLLFTSTSDIYGNSNTFSEDDNITMGAPTNIRYSYALSKWHSEQYILNAVNELSLKASIVRVFGCASPRSSKTWSGGHVPLFTDLAMQNKDIIIHGDGEQTRSISHAIDIARGILNSTNILGQIVNLGTDQETTVKYVAEYIVKKVGSSSKIAYISKEAAFGNYNEIQRRFANTSKAKKLIDYKINYTTEQVIDEIIQEWQK